MTSTWKQVHKLQVLCILAKTYRPSKVGCSWLFLLEPSLPTGRRKKQSGKEILSFEHNKGCIYVHRETLECFLFVWKHRWFWWKRKQSFHWNFLLKRGTPSRDIFLFLFLPELSEYHYHLHRHTSTMAPWWNTRFVCKKIINQCCSIGRKFLISFPYKRKHSVTCSFPLYKKQHLIIWCSNTILL